MSKTHTVDGISYDVGKLSTKQLLKLRDSFYKMVCGCCGMYRYSEGEYSIELSDEYKELKTAVYEELNKRENMLNKNESKELRKYKKKQGRKKPALIK